jgi:SpoVK/Ycf46/Vps4 family AAA+-type ATPase
MIITTNHPEELDTALTRPGRIDMNIRFDKITRKEFQEMYKLWFDIELSGHDLVSLKDRHYTHAEICQLFFENINRPQMVLAVLQNNTIQSFHI